MVLGKLRLLGVPSEADVDDPQRGVDGAPLTFPQMLEDARRTWGDKIAFQQKSRGQWQRFSHIDVYRRSYELAAGLVNLRVAPGDRVAIVAENSVEWVCAYYAIVCSGG